jgi:hypothetical protein
VLAYELFLNNRGSTGTDPKGGQRAIKKIFFNNNDVVIDKMTRDDYGKKYSEKTRQLQDWLQMPLNTENEKRLNLPDYRVSNAQPSPYVQIYGIVKTNKKLETIISISIGKKPNTIEYSLNASTGIIEKNNKSKIKLKIDNQNYFMAKGNLFTAYISSGLLEKDGTLNNNAFDLIATKFLEYAIQTDGYF